MKRGTFHFRIKKQVHRPGTVFFSPTRNFRRAPSFHRDFRKSLFLKKWSKNPFIQKHKVEKHPFFENRQHKVKHLMKNYLVQRDFRMGGPKVISLANLKAGSLQKSTKMQKTLLKPVFQ
jgi:hypothetical protein